MGDSTSGCKPWTTIGLCSNIELEASTTCKSLVGPDDTKIPVLGCFITKFSVNGKCHVGRVFFVDQGKALRSQAACVRCA